LNHREFPLLLTFLGKPAFATSHFLPQGFLLLSKRLQTTCPDSTLNDATKETQGILGPAQIFSVERTPFQRNGAKK
jgi:hypothetical protein